MTKFVVASDIHGSRLYCEKLMDVFHREKADKLLLLGDLYYHGVRNSLSNGYEPKAVVVMLNSVWDKIIAVRGNCDSAVDVEVSNFHIADTTELFENGKSIFASHGDYYNSDNPPKGKYDVVFFGHSHISKLFKRDGIVYANPGSISMPKGDSVNSYMLMENNKIILKSLDGRELESLIL